MRWLLAACSVLALGFMRSMSCGQLDVRTHAREADTRVRAASRRPPALAGFPMAIRSEALGKRRLRGDFETPETLLVVYDRDWEASIQEIVDAAWGQTQVGLLVQREDLRRPKVGELSRRPHVEVLATKLDSPWVRDYGPLQLHDREADLLWIDFDYTWNRPSDDRVPRWLSRVMHARIEASNFAFDGGAVISNGEGLCAVSSPNLLEIGLSPDDRAELVSFLSTLGCETTAILPKIPGEGTGHADMIGQFVSATHVLVAAVDPEQDPEVSRRLDEAAESLLTAASLAGRPLAITRVPIPIGPGKFYSYVNLTKLRSRLLVPHFSEVGAELERRAHDALATAMPELALVPIEADQLITHGGAIHCATLGLGSTKRRHALRAPQKRKRRG